MKRLNNKLMGVMLILSIFLISITPQIDARDYIENDGRCNIGEPCNIDCSGYSSFDCGGGLSCESVMDSTVCVTDSFPFLPFPWVDYDARCQYVEPVLNDGECQVGEGCNEDCIGHSTSCPFSYFGSESVCTKVRYKDVNHQVGTHYTCGITGHEPFESEEYKIVCAEIPILYRFMEYFKEET